MAVGATALDANTTASNNTAVGYLASSANTTGANNTSLGQAAQESNTTGTQNTALGRAALNANTTADNNTAVGYNSLLVNTTGAQNTALGSGVLDANTTGGSNTGAGYLALSAATTGAGLSAFGKGALFACTTANYNDAFGHDSQASTTTGAQNASFGAFTLDANTTGEKNSAHGYNALTANTTGSNNSAYGHSALISNTTGSQNDAFGYVALSSNTTGDDNAAFGTGALDANTTAGLNSAFGRDALGANTTGASNTACGAQSLDANTTGFQNVTVNVNDLGVTEESFLTSLVASGAYIEEVINTGATDLKSDLIKGNLWSDNATFTDVQFPTYQTSVSAFGAGIVKGSWGGVASNAGGAGASTNVDLGPGFVKLIQGTTNLVGGTNGDGNGDTDAEAAALIGVTSPTRTGMQALNEELVPITIAIVPGITSETVQNNLITLAETTGNFIAVLGTPIGIGQPADAIDFANGQTPYRSASLNSSYAALYYPAVKVFQPFLGKDIFMDPAIFAVRQMGYTDTVADLWFAPAGFVRGRLTKPTDTEVDINQGDRDSLYSGGNIVNPIVNFPQQGITIFGQKTTQRAATALDRINVRRLMVYIKRVILQSTQRFIFEPNDKITQERIQTLLVPLFEDIKRRRGITEFKVICDETVNTPVRVDRNELWCKILIKPTKAAEVLVFELNVTSQATNISS